jgi:hypothetical protein
VPDLSHLVGERNPHFDRCAKGIIDNSTYSYDCLVPDLVENIWAPSQRRTLKRIVVHLDNAHLHNSGQSCECPEGFRARRVPHLAYNPDPSPNNSFPIGYLKTKLVEHVIQNREERISMIKQVFDQIPRERLIDVCLLWKTRRRE